MSAIDVIEKISTTSIFNSNLKYCLVSADKHPYKIDNSPARPNKKEDFVEFEELLNCDKLDEYKGVGISIQASEICAIDVDHCFSIPNDINSGDERAKDILNLFKDLAYCEFSFSGTGLRILFQTDIIDNYSNNYYIKNSDFGIEYYQPSNSFRYVTITGNCIYDNLIKPEINIKDTLYVFLNKYMKRKIIISDTKKEVSEETKTYEELMKMVKCLYRKNEVFQDLWFHPAPGSGKDESERDYHLIACLYENITKDKEMLKQIFESSEFYKTKDYKHRYKWTNQNFRYFNYVYDMVQKTH